MKRRLINLLVIVSLTLGIFALQFGPKRAKALKVFYSEQPESRAITELWAALIRKKFDLIVTAFYIPEKLTLPALKAQKDSLSLTLEVDPMNPFVIAEVVPPFTPGFLVPTKSQAKSIEDLNHLPFEHHIFYNLNNTRFLPQARLALQEYDLFDYELNPLSTAAFRRFISFAENRKKNIVLFYYEPDLIELTFLADPKKAFQPTAPLYAAADKSFREQFPQIEELIKRTNIDYNQYLKEYYSNQSYPDLIIQKWVALLFLRLEPVDQDIIK